MRTQFLVQRNIFQQSFDILVASKSFYPLKCDQYAAPLVFSEYEQGLYVQPTLSLSDEEVQGLMDELWTAGIRPSNGEGSAGQLLATQNHLNDMRKLVFEERK